MRIVMIQIFILVVFSSNIVQSQSTVPLWKTLPEVPAMPIADQSGLAKVNDTNIYYAVYNKDGKDPVILLHGGFVSSDYWGFEVALLAKTHKVIVLDSRGHGRSSFSNQPFSYDLMASDVLKLMDHLKINKASIIGWSDGGIIGLLIAIHHPERLNKLFTFGSNYNLSGYKHEPMDSALATKFMTRVQSEYRKLSPTPDSFFVFRNALGKMYSSQPDIMPSDLKAIKSFTVVACGEYEQFIKREHFEELAKLIPGASLVVIPNVSHGGPIQDPIRFHQEVMKLLKN